MMLCFIIPKIIAQLWKNWVLENNQEKGHKCINVQFLGALECMIFLWFKRFWSYKKISDTFLFYHHAGPHSMICDGIWWFMVSQYKPRFWKFISLLLYTTELVLNVSPGNILVVVENIDNWLVVTGSLNKYHNGLDHMAIHASLSYKVVT